MGINVLMCHLATNRLTISLYGGQDQLADNDGAISLLSPIDWSRHIITTTVLKSAWGEGFASKLQRYFINIFIESKQYPAQRNVKWFVWHYRRWPVMSAAVGCKTWPRYIRAYINSCALCSILSVPAIPRPWDCADLDDLQAESAVVNCVGN